LRKKLRFFPLFHYFVFLVMSGKEKEKEKKEKEKSETKEKEVEKKEQPRKSVSGGSKGDKLVQEAERKLKSISWFNPTKDEEAIEIYDKAAAQFKIEKDWEKAAETYVKAAELCEKQKNVHEASTHYQSAAKCYKNVSPKEAIKMYTIAITLTQENNKFTTAAKLWKEIATLEEKQLHTKEAIKAWSECATCYEADDVTASANQALLKVAELAAEEEDYKRSIGIYEKVAQSAMDSTLGRWSVKDYLFKSLLCSFVMNAKTGDVKGTAQSLGKYKESFPAFDGSREAKLIENTLTAFNENDHEKFTNFVRDYDRISKLDNWTAKILLDIKTVLKEGVENDTDGETGDYT